MLTLLLILLPILVVDQMNPVLLAASVFCLGSRRPSVNASVMLAGYFVVYLLAGVGLALGLDAVIDLLSDPRPVDFAIQAVIAFVLLWVAWRWTRPAAKEKQREREFGDTARLKPAAALRLGVVVNLISLPLALPYFAALDQIMKADAGWVVSIVVLVIYNVLYVSPFAGLIVIRWISGRRSEVILQRVNRWMSRGSDVVMPLLLVLLGLVLVADAGAYVFTGVPLIQVGPVPAPP